MKNKLLLGICLALLNLVMPFDSHATIGWGYESWVDGTLQPPADGSVDEWGRFQLSFVPGTRPGESTGVANIDDGQNYGKIYYGTGLTSAQVTGQFRYLYCEMFDVQGDFKMALSGPGDTDFFMASQGANLVASSGPTGAPPTGDFVFNPGAYVFDVSSWAPGTPVGNVSVQFFGEGDPNVANQGFEIRRVFFTDDLNSISGVTLLVPEPSTLAMLATGLLVVGGWVRRRTAS